MRLISEGTIEESILALSQEKLLLEQEVSSNEGTVFCFFLFFFNNLGGIAGLRWGNTFMSI